MIGVKGIFPIYGRRLQSSWTAALLPTDFVVSMAISAASLLPYHFRSTCNLFIIRGLLKNRVPCRNTI